MLAAGLDYWIPVLHMLCILYSLQVCCTACVQGRLPTPANADHVSLFRVQS